MSKFTWMALFIGAIVCGVAGGLTDNVLVGLLSGVSAMLSTAACFDLWLKR